MTIQLKFEAANSAPVPGGGLWEPAEFILMLTNHLEADAQISLPHSTSTAPAYLGLVAGIVCIAWSAILVRWTDIPGPASAFYRMLVPL